MTSSRERGEVFGPRFELFSDMLSLGLATTLACLPIVTIPAALSTACAALRRRMTDGMPIGAVKYVVLLASRLRGPRLRGDLLAGLVLVLLVLVLAVDLALADAGLPGGEQVTSVLLVVTAMLSVVGLRAVAVVEAERGWLLALGVAANAITADPSGTFLLCLAVLTAVLCAWMLPPLAVLVPGPLVLAATAVEARRGVRPE